ncbi:hypothetical protein FACS1894172_07190 [Spirochaetia bacterium]|nr:hypothetical protein FACS1894172_07190 [Spirochaetia bacterium]
MKIAFLELLLMTAGIGFAQEQFSVSGSIDWDKREITVTSSLNLESASIRLPTGRVRAEESLRASLVQAVRPFILEVPVDSANKVGDLVTRGDMSLQQVDELARGVKQIPASLSPDLTEIRARYIVNLNEISSALIRHTSAADIPHSLTPTPATAYTGIIIIANDPLPIHGRHESTLAVPSLFPKIWDTSMNLIFERNLMDPQIARNEPIVHYVSANRIFQSTPSGMDAELLARVGPRPFRILAREIFGIYPTDIVIDPADALLLVSSEENRKLLREGRITFVLNDEVL